MKVITKTWIRIDDIERSVIERKLRERGITIGVLCAKHNFPRESFYAWVAGKQNMDLERASTFLSAIGLKVTLEHNHDQQGGVRSNQEGIQHSSGRVLPGENRQGI